MTKEKKLFNFRPILFCALCLASGIAISSAIFVFGFNFVYFLISSIIILSGALIFKFKSVRNFLAKHFIFVIFAAALFVVGLFSFSIKANLFKANDYRNFYIEAKEARVIANNGNYLLVDNVVADCFSYKQNNFVYNFKFDGKFYVNLNEENRGEFEVGEIISFKGYVLFFNFVKDDGQINASIIYYNTIGSVSNSTITSLNRFESTDLFMGFRNSVNNVLHENMTFDAANLSFSMLFGDKSELSQEIIDNFKTTGISHLLAVSGLHVGFLVALLALILKIFKIKPKPRAIIIISVIFLYAWVCGFSPSVTRAAIMTTIILLASVRGRQYDILNSLSISSIIILLFNPGALFSTGFRLSVMAVLFISLLSKPFEKIFSRKLNRAFSSAIGVALAAQIGTLPIILTFYSKYSVLSILANLFIIPIASLAFEILVCCLFICALFGGLTLVLKLPQMIFDLIILISRIVANSKFLVNLKIGTISVLLIVILACVISNYTFASPKLKRWCWMAMLLVFIASLSINLIFKGV